MSDFTLGSIDPLPVNSYDGFDRPNNSALITLIGDGVSSDNQVLQQGALPLRQAHVGGLTTDNDVISDLRSYYDAKTEITFTDCDGGSYQVRILDLTTARGQVGRRTYQATLLAAD